MCLWESWKARGFSVGISSPLPNLALLPVLLTAEQQTPPPIQQVKPEIYILNAFCIFGSSRYHSWFTSWGIQMPCIAPHCSHVRLSFITSYLHMATATAHIRAVISSPFPTSSRGLSVKMWTFSRGTSFYALCLPISLLGTCNLSSESPKRVWILPAGASLRLLSTRAASQFQTPHISFCR